MKVHFDIEVDAPAADAWQVLGEEFGDISAITASLDSSSLRGPLGVGCVRECKSSQKFGPFEGGAVEEELIEFDRENRVFEYRVISGLPRILKSAGNRWSIETINDIRCIVHSCATIELRWWAKVLGPVLVPMMQKDLNRIRDEIRYRIEKGEPMPSANPPAATA